MDFLNYIVILSRNVKKKIEMGEKNNKNMTMFKKKNYISLVQG